MRIIQHNYRELCNIIHRESRHQKRVYNVKENYTSKHALNNKNKKKKMYHRIKDDLQKLIPKYPYVTIL